MPGKRAARHARQEGRLTGLRPLAVAATIVVAALAVAVVIGVRGLGGDGPQRSDGDRPSSGQAQAKPSGTEGASPKASPSKPSSGKPSGAGSSGPRAQPATWLRACQVDAARADRAIAAAAGGVRHWRQHVQARTDMLEERISEKRMQAIWDRTQDAGPADQRRFHTALSKYDGHRHCGKPARVRAPDRQRATACLTRSRLLAHAVRDARGAMRDWEVHLANMAKYRHHRMSAALAQGKWVKAWRNAPKNISAYREARSALAEAPSCGSSGNS